MTLRIYSTTSPEPETLGCHYQDVDTAIGELQARFGIRVASVEHNGAFYTIHLAHPSYSFATLVI